MLRKIAPKPDLVRIEEEGKTSPAIQPKRTLKPIFPKLSNLVQLCYICDAQLLGTGLSLAQHSTETTNTSLATMIGNIFSNSCMIIITQQDVICRNCFRLFNEADHLESALQRIQGIIRGLLFKKYNIADSTTEDKSSKGLDPVSTNKANVERVNYEVVQIETKPRKSQYKNIAPKPSSTVTKPIHTCNMCDVNFESRKSLRSHKIKVHLSTWTCHFCNASFEDEVNFTDHIASHLRSAAHRCQECSTTFMSEEQLVEHIEKEHENGASPKIDDDPEKSIGESVYTCILCSMEFDNADAFNEHAQAHETLSGLDLGNLGKNDTLSLDVFEGASESVDLLDINMFDGNAESTEDRFICVECDVHLESIEEMKHHIKEEHGISEWSEDVNMDSVIGSCTVCGIEFTDEDSANRHPQECQGLIEESKRIICEVCGSDETENGLEAHRSVCGIGIIDVKVDDEETSVVNKDEDEANTKLEQAEFTVKNTKQKKVSCLCCGNEFPNKTALYLHEKDNPDHLSVIQCPDCEMMFNRQRALNEHRESNHLTSHCRFCMKAFTNLKQVKAHESRHIRQEKTAKTHFVCSECGCVYMTATGLRHHQAIHTGNYAYSCEFCGKGFSSRSRSEEHRASHTKEARYTCEICNLKFSFQGTYWIHKKWHENPKPYKCEECGKLFKHSSLLSVHRRKHTGDKPYACHYCDQAFAVSTSLKRHLTLHTGVFPYKCNICNTGFSAKHIFATHMNKVHQDNTLIEQQEKNSRKKNYKMLVKEVAPTLPSNVESWIPEEQNSQYLTAHVEDGERELLSEEMLQDNADAQLNNINTNARDFVVFQI